MAHEPMANLCISQTQHSSKFLKQSWSTTGITHTKSSNEPCLFYFSGGGGIVLEALLIVIKKEWHLNYMSLKQPRGGGGRNQGFKSNLNYILLLFFLIVNIKNAYHANQRITVCISWILVWTKSKNPPSSTALWLFSASASFSVGSCFLFMVAINENTFLASPTWLWTISHRHDSGTHL